MRQISLALMAAGLLAVSALPAAASGQKSDTNGISKTQIGSVDLSARRYHRAYRGYRHGYYRPYYQPYYRPYAYGPGPYYYGYRPYYRPAPFPFFPFF